MASQLQIKDKQIKDLKIQLHNTKALYEYKINTLFNKLESMQNEFELKFNKMQKIIDDQAIIISKQQQRIESLEIENKRLKAENAKLKEENVKLKNEVDRLKKQINNNSNNSSNPPSSDIKPNKKDIPNNRDKSGKKIGGQLGHTGFHLSRKYVEKNIKNNNFVHEIKHIGNISDKYVSKYILDISVNVKAIEHRFYPDENGKIIIPKEFQTDVQYGSELKTLCSVLNVEGIVPFKRLADFVSCISHGELHISDASIVNFLKNLDEKSQYVIENIRRNVLNSTLLNTDATTVRCKEQNMSVRNHSTNDTVLFCATVGKSKKYIEETGILNNYTGTLVHDHETSMYSYGTKHVECNVHVSRYLKGNLENTKNTWSSALRHFLCSLNEYRKYLIQIGTSSFSNEQLDRYSKKYDELLELGFKQNSKLQSKFYKKEERALLNRLKKYKENHLMFLYDFGMPFDNNMSERDLRHIKVKQKVSGHFNTVDGLKIYCDIKSIICTFKKRGKDFYSAISNIYQNIPVSI